MNFYAHTAEDVMSVRLPEEHWQLLAVHLRNVATLAKEFARPLGMEAEAEIVALLHDLGKYQEQFQEYLRFGRPRTPHAVIGAAAIVRRNIQLANIIASHHAGLNNWDELEPGLKDLCEKRGKELRKYLSTMDRETDITHPKIPVWSDDEATLAELRVRLLFSVLVDADYLDTEAFHLSVAGKSSPRGDYPRIEELASRLKKHLDRLESENEANPLNKLRECINDRCRDGGSNALPGVFSLAVPTGGGKTFSSANFALHHALKNRFDRVIYVLPYTTILEQNGQEFAKIFGKGAVLEHYGLADWASGATGIDNWRSKLAAENWDAPFILTTNVQFFESLLSHKPSSCRKLHRLLNSVIIFDECQTFPPDLLAPTLERLKALTAFGRTSLVFCTATQPAFRRQSGFMEGFEDICEIIPEEWRLHDRPEFRRTNSTFRREAISVEMLCNELRTQSQALVVLNTRRCAWEVFTKLGDEGVFHLSTLLCPAHRRYVLDQIKIRLKNPESKCLVISTQLIEAGVDIDFPKVYRALAPLDSVIQAAGRCNREGKIPGAAGEVIIFRFTDAILPGSTYRKGTEITEGILPSYFEGNLPPEMIHRYFQSLYQLSNRDKHNFQQLCAEKCYRQIGEKYRWIDSDSEQVLTDYSAIGKQLQAQFQDDRYSPVSRVQRREIGPYCINLRRAHIEEELRSSPKLVRLPNGLVLTQKSYDAEFGYNHFGRVNPDIMIV